jgi:hypothetical protein
MKGQRPWPIAHDIRPHGSAEPRPASASSRPGKASAKTGADYKRPIPDAATLVQQRLEAAVVYALVEGFRHEWAWSIARPGHRVGASGA